MVSSIGRISSWKRIKCSICSVIYINSNFLALCNLESNSRINGNWKEFPRSTQWKKYKAKFCNIDLCSWGIDACAFKEISVDNPLPCPPTLLDLCRGCGSKIDLDQDDNLSEWVAWGAMHPYTRFMKKLEVIIMCEHSTFSNGHYFINVRAMFFFGLIAQNYKIYTWKGWMTS